jgi:hypothetical protein
MAISVIPAPSAASGNTFTATIPAAYKRYKSVNTFTTGIYTITCNPTSSEATLIFFNGTSKILETTTTSGSVVVNLSTEATYVLISINTGTNIAVTIDKTAAALSSPEISGTLDTITTTSTYNQTGPLYVLLFGGGGGGAVGAGGGGGAGGGSGYGLTSFIYTNSATSVIVGGFGAGGANGGSGGTTSFGNTLNAAGGGGGAQGGGGGAQGGIGGTGGASGGNGAGNIRSASAGAVYGLNEPTILGTSPNVGSGGGSHWTGPGLTYSGGVGNIGTGGNGHGSGGPNGGNANGYGSGGGGCASGYTAGSGSPGVVYVLRGF